MMKIKKQSFAGRMLLSPVIFVLALMIAVTPAAAVCSNASLSGEYGYLVGRAGGIDANLVIVGQLNADGAGNVVGPFTRSFGGTIITGTFFGTYKISKDCTGTMSLDDGTGSQPNFFLALDDSKKGFQMIRTDNGTDQPGFGLAQGTQCALTGGKKQTFAISLAASENNNSKASSFVGQMNVDVHGQIKGAWAYSKDGTTGTDAFSGRYQPINVCTGFLFLQGTGFSHEYTVVSVNGGKELLLMENDTGTLVAGTAQQ
jgi:hypothetical protein